MIKILLSIFLGGGIGSIARWLLSSRLNLETFPYGTLMVNALGGLLMGVGIWFIESKGLSHDFRYFVIVGFLGGFTTFSSFGREVFAMLRNSEILKAMIYLSISNFSVVLCVALGFFIMRQIFKVG